VWDENKSNIITPINPNDSRVIEKAIRDKIRFEKVDLKDVLYSVS